MIGLGTMGAGIAEVFARNGYQVVGVEVTDETLERGRQHLEHSTGRAVKRGKLSEEDQAELVGRITFTTDMADLTDAGLSSRRSSSRWRQAADLPRARRHRPPDAILATNTSSLSSPRSRTATRTRAGSSACTSSTPRRCRTSSRSSAPSSPSRRSSTTPRRWSPGSRKTPVVCGDKAGFIANALLFGYLNHAASMFEAAYATREDLDAAMRFGCGYPMGPLALLDLIGLDTAYEILDTMYKQGRDRLHAPAPILKQMVTAGLLGRKSGRGFYTYEGPDSPVVVDDAHPPAADDQPQLRHDIGTSASSAPARWPPASSRSSPRPASP